MSKPAHVARPLRLVVVGHVDHGKSTLVGRLLHETGSLPDGKMEAVRAAAERRGMAFEWAFLLDALQAERDQGITIDTTQILLHTPGRATLVIDAPGHREFLKNMISGAAAADAAVLVVDAVEGLREQTRRHAYLLRLLGLRQVVVAVNKMDAIAWDAERFAAISEEVSVYLADIGAPPTCVVPISARTGGNLASRTPEAAWHKGPTLIDALGGLAIHAEAADLPLRFTVQDVLKLDHRRIVAGRIESGWLRVGDELTFAPTGKKAKVASIESWNVSAPVIAGIAGQAIGITLDDHLFVERGQIAAHAEQAPDVAHAVKARLFWLGKTPLTVGMRYRLRLATAEHLVEVADIERVIDVESLGQAATAEVRAGGVAEVVLRSRTAMAFDPFVNNAHTGRFVLVDGMDVTGGGIIVSAAAMESRAPGPKSENLFPVGHRVAEEARWLVNGHRGGIIWLTGLSASGKSTIAMEVERRLVQRGRQAFVLDGDNLRQGLNSDLGFSPEDRTENIRRVGEVAALFASAGMVVLTAFISPYRNDRDRVRHLAPETFNEVYVKASVEECQRRDPKGLYARAVKGEIPEFTGISAPYEAPVSPELVLETEGRSPAECAAELVDYIERTLLLDVRASQRRAEG